MRKVDPAKHDEKRRHILEAARHSFIEKGFRGTSIADICAAAQMSPGHLYHYFPSKEAIIEAIVAMGLERVATMTGRLARRTHIVDALLAEIEQRQLGGRRPRFGLMLEMEAEAARNPAIAKIMRHRDRAMRAMVGQLIRAGQERGQIDAALDPDLAVTVMMAAIQGLRLREFKDPDFGIRERKNAITLLIERFLLAQRAAPSKRKPTRAAKMELKRETP